MQNENILYSIEAERRRGRNRGRVGGGQKVISHKFIQISALICYFIYCVYVEPMFVNSNRTLVLFFYANER